MLARKSVALLLCLLLAVCAWLVGCGSDPSDSDDHGDEGEEVRSDAERDTSPDVTDAELAALVAGNTQFALELYDKGRSGAGNLFLSPYSISLAFSMLFGGAAGDTSAQMASTFHFAQEAATHHAAFDRLDLELLSRAQAVATGVDARDAADGFQLSIANAMWGQKDFGFLDSYLDLLAISYGAGMRVADFGTDPDGVRQTVNGWVAEQTADKIKDILPPGSLSTATRFVLANAIYFLAKWESQFSPDSTITMPFHTLSGDTVDVQMMRQTSEFGYAAGDGYQAAEMPYTRPELSMVAIVPDAGQFGAFEASLNAAVLQQILSGLQGTSVQLSLPRFRIESTLDLKELLPQMGMTDAFVPLVADFSSMDGARDLFVSVALHKAYVSVDEAGTEAGAATVIGGEVTALPGETLTIDRPFFFVIRDKPTGAVLFVGRVVNPAA